VREQRKGESIKHAWHGEIPLERGGKRWPIERFSRAGKAGPLDQGCRGHLLAFAHQRSITRRHTAGASRAAIAARWIRTGDHTPNRLNAGEAAARRRRAAVGAATAANAGERFTPLPAHAGLGAIRIVGAIHIKTRRSGTEWKRQQREKQPELGPMNPHRPTASASEDPGVRRNACIGIPSDWNSASRRRNARRAFGVSRYTPTRTPSASVRRVGCLR
jgi:hypothetical protein